MDIQSPKRFTTPVILAMSAYGLLISVPVLLAFLAISVHELSLWTCVTPIAALALTTFFLPFGFGNARIVSLLRSDPSISSPGAPRFIVQMTLFPRLRSGWRALIEDADDIGWLEVLEGGLQFRGDSVTLTVPWSRISRIRLKSSGWRGLFAYGARIVLETSAIEGVVSLQFAERSSWIVPSSRRNARNIYQALAGASAGFRDAAASPRPSAGVKASGQNGPGAAST